MNYDIFNGDADGIIALLQWRLANPQENQLITGVKRDIELLKRVECHRGDVLTVLDISLEKNSHALQAALKTGAEVFYADHHRAGQVPVHPRLTSHLNFDADTCTALIIDELLQGSFHDWAIVAAYGDNLVARADALARRAGHTSQQRAVLKKLGVLINYNGYGETISDLHYHPADLYRTLLNYTSPFDVIADQNSPYIELESAYQADMQVVRSLSARYESEHIGVFELDDSPVSRRVSGVYGNWLANACPWRAHVVLTHSQDGYFKVSLRAPLDNRHGAGEVCSQFATGGGRAAAGGINQLAVKDVDAFITAVENYYRQ